MSNKIQLQINNINLQSLITRVNAAKDIAASLPEASGPGLPSNPEDLPASVTFLVRILKPGSGDLMYVNAFGVKTTFT